MIAACFYANGALELRQAYILNKESGNTDRNRRLCAYASTKFAIKGIDVVGSILLFFVGVLGILCDFGVMKQPMTSNGIPILAICAVIGFAIFAFIPSCCDVIRSVVEDKMPTHSPASRSEPVDKFAFSRNITFIVASIIIISGIAIRIAAIEGSIILRGTADFIPELLKIAGAIMFIVLFGTIFVPALKSLLCNSSEPEPESSNRYDYVSASQIDNGHAVQL